MPARPACPCRYPGCAVATTTGFCKRHRDTARAEQKRGHRELSRARRRDPDDLIHFYVTPAWRKVRLQHLAREPLCRHCRDEGFIVTATVVDHIVPIVEGGARLDENNLQSLSKKHHTRKTRRELNARR
jgi:5-methylcytosine-specific restriction enzyme A